MRSKERSSRSQRGLLAVAVGGALVLPGCTSVLAGEAHPHRDGSSTDARPTMNVTPGSPTLKYPDLCSPYVLDLIVNRAKPLPGEGTPQISCETRSVPDAEAAAHYELSGYTHARPNTSSTHIETLDISVGRNGIDGAGKSKVREFMSTTPGAASASVALTETVALGNCGTASSGGATRLICAAGQRVGEMAGENLFIDISVVDGNSDAKTGLMQATEYMRGFTLHNVYLGIR